MALLFSSNQQLPKQHIPTYISISPKKNGNTAKIKRLNSHNSSPLKRKLKSTSISAILPKLRVRNSSHHRRLSTLSNQSSDSDINQKKSNLVNLPTEILSNILYHLDYKSVQKFSRTCYKMYLVCQDNSLWSKLLSADFSISSPSRTKQDIIMPKKQKFPFISTRNMKIYQNYLRLGHNWSTGKVTTKFLDGHTSSIYCLDWIDQTTIISGSRDKTMKVWNCDTGECLRTIDNGHDGSVLCLKVNQDKTLLASGSSDATCIIWSLPDLRPIHQFRGHGHSILSVSFVNNWLITASRDHTIRIWDIETKSEIKQLLGHHGSVNSIEIIDKERIASASGDATIKFWDIHTGLCTSTIEAKQLGLATIRYNGRYLFSGGLNGKIKAWDIESGECVNTLTGHISMIRSIDYIQGKIISGSYDRTLKVWDAETGACLLCFQSGHSNWIFNVLSSNTRIISSGQENRIMMIDFGSDLKPLV